MLIWALCRIGASSATGRLENLSDTGGFIVYQLKRCGVLTDFSDPLNKSRDTTAFHKDAQRHGYSLRNLHNTFLNPIFRAILPSLLSTWEVLFILFQALCSPFQYSSRIVCFVIRTHSLILFSCFLTVFRSFIMNSSSHPPAISIVRDKSSLTDFF